jgi:nucleoside-triphosphatase THEP1
MIILVTGEIGCGKTTACQRAIDLLRAQGVAVSGILCPPRLDNRGVKVGIDALDVATGEEKRLADWVPGGGDTIGPFTFDQASYSWAIARLQSAIAALDHAEGVNVLVVDEIGPLELVRQSGFVAALGSLADPRRVPCGLVVVRKAYLEILERRISRPDLRRVWVDAVRREQAPSEIAAAF